MKKLILSFIVLILFSIGTLAFAKNSNRYAPTSEDAVRNRTYEVENRPDLKVKVFVYKEKGYDKNHAKPDGTPKPPKDRGDDNSESVCSITEDPQSNAEVGSTEWYLPPRIEYHLNIDSVPSSVGSGNLSSIVNNSFSSWQNALGNNALSIIQASDTTKNRSNFDGENIISWGRTSKSTLGVTYIWYYTDTGEVAEVDTIMNKRVSWKWSTDANCAFPEVYDAQNIMVHELGHWFGLDDEYTSDFTNNTMYGYGSKGEVKKNTLTDGDIIGIKNLGY